MLVTNEIFATNEICVIKDDDKLIEKSVKLKTEKLLKSLKLSKSKKSKSEKLAQSKKPSKSGNLSKFATKKGKPGRLIFNIMTAFNHLELAFIIAPIF